LFKFHSDFGSFSVRGDVPCSNAESVNRLWHLKRLFSVRYILYFVYHNVNNCDVGCFVFAEYYSLFFVRKRNKNH